MSSNGRFNSFWVIIFSIMVGYLAYYFVGSYIITGMVPESNFKDLLSIFLMISFMIFIYLFLNFLLENKLPDFFYYIIWFYYFLLIFVLSFCIEKNVTGFNLNPFKTVNKSFFEFFMFLIKNVVLFLPIGFLLRKEEISKTLVIVILLELSVELSQAVLRVGQFDINEIFFNVIGIYLGYFAFKKEKKRKYKKRQRKASTDI